MTQTSDTTHPATLWEGYWGIQILHVGQSLGLFGAFEQSRTSVQAANALNLDVRYVQLWCRAAQSAGLLESKDDHYRTPPQHADWIQMSEGFTHSHLHLVGRANETLQALFHGRALPEPPISLKLILQESLSQNYRWLFQDIPRQFPDFGKVLDQAHRVLEVSCGLGLGLGVLRTLYSNLELYGLEPDYECAREAERATRAVIHVGDFPAERFEKEFDVVVCFRGLASSPDPEKLLQQCSRVLGPKGWLVLGSETSGSGDSRKTATRSLGEHFTYQLLAGQSPINVFSHENLTEMLTKAGFRVENEIAAPDWGTPLYLCSHQGYSG